MYTLSFTLKQHTPIIHFQHDQDGATLRATEVKPKLDRFIIEKNGGFDTLKRDQKNWFTGGLEHPALDYKLRIIDGSIQKPMPIKYSKTRDGKFRPEFPCIFGNVDSEDQQKVFKISDQLKVIITCKNQDLKQLIDNNIKDFFLNNNFGFRQSKGFGCFEIEDNDFSGCKGYHFAVDVSKINGNYEKFYTVFDDINLLYKTLRSGINTSNFGGIYFKSLMFMYAKSPEFDEQWDKRTIREKLYSEHDLYIEVKGTRKDPEGSVHHKAKNQNNILFRDLLGLSTEQDWMGYGIAKTDREGKKILKNGKTQYKSDVVSKESLSGNVERFQSPLLFKPIKRKEKDIYDVYIIAKSIPDGFKNETFRIKSKSYPGKNFTMRPPASFDINNFLNFCFKNIFPDEKALDSHIQGNKGIRDSKRLKEIFNELRNNL